MIRFRLPNLNSIIEVLISRPVLNLCNLSQVRCGWQHTTSTVQFLELIFFLFLIFSYTEFTERGIITVPS